MLYGSKQNEREIFQLRLLKLAGGTLLNKRPTCETPHKSKKSSKFYLLIVSEIVVIELPKRGALWDQIRKNVHSKGITGCLLGNARLIIYSVIHARIIAQYTNIYI